MLESFRTLSFPSFHSLLQGVFIYFHNFNHTYMLMIPKPYLLLWPLFCPPKTYIYLVFAWIDLEIPKTDHLTDPLSGSIHGATIYLVSQDRYSGISLHSLLLSKSKRLLNSTNLYLNTKFVSHSCLWKLALPQCWLPGASLLQIKQIFHWFLDCHSPLTFF